MTRSRDGRRNEDGVSSPTWWSYPVDQTCSDVLWLIDCDSGSLFLTMLDPPRSRVAAHAVPTPLSLEFEKGLRRLSQSDGLPNEKPVPLPN